jgi:hypothetical protein
MTRKGKHKGKRLVPAAVVEKIEQARLVAAAWRLQLTGYVCQMYIHAMKWISMFLTETQIKRLQAQTKVTGLKVSELIRRFIDGGLDASENKTRRR